MAESREYYTQPMENGSIQISEEVIASIAAMSASEVEGVSGLSANFGSDIAEMFGVKNAGKGITLTAGKDNSVCIQCDVVAKFGVSIFELAKAVQEAVKTGVESVTGLSVAQVNVNICGIALPRDGKK